MATLDKGLSLFYSLSMIIADPRPVHLGALGTHWLEHLFGNVRRLCNRNDTPGNFERCLILTMIKTLAMANCHNECRSRKRLSDSGTFLDSEATTSSSQFPLGSLIHEAGYLLKFNLSTLPSPLNECLRYTAQFPTRFRKDLPPVLQLVKGCPETHECGSTTASRMLNVAGLTTRKRDILGSQL